MPRTCLRKVGPHHERNLAHAPDELRFEVEQFNKQVVTADHVGRGRTGLNVVSGWNVEEFFLPHLAL